MKSSRAVEAARYIFVESALTALCLLCGAVVLLLLAQVVEGLLYVYLPPFIGVECSYVPDPPSGLP